MQSELKPCPFCGSDNICPSSFDIQCQECKAMMAGEPADAADRWNRRALTAALSDKQAVEVNDAAVNAAARVHDHWTGDGTVGAMNAIRNTQEIVQSYLGASRSALVGVPAVEPVAKQWCSYEDGQQHTSWYPDGYGDRAGWEALAKRNPAKYRVVTRDLFTSPPPSREGEDSAEVERMTRPIVGIEHRTAQEVFDIMADRIRLAATRSGSATGQKGVDRSMHHPLCSVQKGGYCDYDCPRDYTPPEASE